MNHLDTDLLQTSWFVWGIVLMIAFPLLVVILGELGHKLEKNNSPWNELIRFIQRFIIPQLVLLLIFTRLLEFEEDDVIVKLIETLLWIFLIYAAMTVVNLLFFTDSQNSRWRIRVPKLLLDFSRILVVALGTAFVLSNIWGLELGKMLAALGVGSIVLGLALQDTLSSLIAGFSLVSSRQFRLDDWLEVDGTVGKVININWRTMSLLDRNEDVIVIPNSQLSSAKFLNFSYPYPRHVERVDFDFSFDDPPYKVKKALIDAALKTEGILSEPTPIVDLVSYDEFSIRHQIRFFIEDYQKLPIIRDRFISSIWYVAKREGLTFPTRAHEVAFISADNHNEQQTQIHETLHILQNAPIFRDKNDQLLNDIASDSKHLVYGKGEFITQQNKRLPHFLLILSGEATEYYQDTEGELHHLNTLNQGDVFGLVSLFRNSPQTVSIISLSDTTVLAINEQNMEKILQQYPTLSDYIEQLIDAQQKEINLLEHRIASKHQLPLT
ncbi:MAG: cyclic nucleotide-binding domain-containing protein [bacterium]